MSDTNHPNPNIWWKNRRRMAYIAIVWVILQTFLWAILAAFIPAAIGSLGVVIGWSYGVPATIIVGYYSNTAVEEAVKHKRNPS